MKTLKTPNRLSLSVASIEAESRNVDWNADPDDRETCGVPLERERSYELVFPAPTYDDLRQYRWGIERDAALVKAADSRARDDRPLSDDLRAAFEQSEGASEWRGGFEPMMNYVWPVCLAYEVTAQQAADLIAQFAPVCTLVEFSDSDLIGEEHGIALSGGGMNLADQLAVAYLCCGCVPPTRLLSDLPGVIGAHKVKEVGPALRKAYRAAADYHRSRAARLAEDARRVFAKPRPAA